MSVKNYLAIDLGATSGRSIIATYDGKKVEMKELTRFKKIHAEWIKFAIPMILAWVGYLCWDLFRNGSGIDPILRYGFLAGVVAGVILGGLLGFKIRRDQLNAADDLLDQLEELHRDN